MQSRFELFPYVIVLLATRRIAGKGLGRLFVGGEKLRFVEASYAIKSFQNSKTVEWTACCSYRCSVVLLFHAPLVIILVQVCASTAFSTKSCVPVIFVCP